MVVYLRNVPLNVTAVLPISLYVVLDSGAMLSSLVSADVLIPTSLIDGVVVLVAAKAAVDNNVEMITIVAISLVNTFKLTPLSQNVKFHTSNFDSISQKICLWESLCYVMDVFIFFKNVGLYCRFILHLKGCMLL